MQTPRFISISQVLDIHQDEINSFGGTSGVRDEGLLDSALAQPQATFGGELLHPTIHEQAASYLYHLAMNHPFIDGNKRTAFAVMDTFITLNAYSLNVIVRASLQLGDSSSPERNIQRRIICISRTASTSQVNR